MSPPSAQDLNRAHFASYDIIVYFGGGLFFLIILAQFNLIDPRFPNFDKIPTKEPIVSSIIQILFYAFLSYIAGHFVAYVSDQLIEKPFVQVFGYPVDWIGELSSPNRRDKIDNFVSSNIILAKSNHYSATVIRAIFHTPMVPAYLFFIGRLKMDGFYRSRLPEEISQLIEKKIKQEKLPTAFGNPKWFRFVEQYVIINSPQASVRLYNYVIIYGILRTLCFTIIFVLWIVILKMLWNIFETFYNGDSFSFDFSLTYENSLLLSFFCLSVVGMSMMFSFGKFYRRYSEEAIFAFCLAKDSK